MVDDILRKQRPLREKGLENILLVQFPHKPETQWNIRITTVIIIVTSSESLSSIIIILVTGGNIGPVNMPKLATNPCCDFKIKIMPPG